MHSQLPRCLVELFSLGAFVLSQYTRLTDGRTESRQQYHAYASQSHGKNGLLTWQTHQTTDTAVYLNNTVVLVVHILQALLLFTSMDNTILLLLLSCVKMNCSWSDDVYLLKFPVWKDVYKTTTGMCSKWPPFTNRRIQSNTPLSNNSFDDYVVDAMPLFFKLAQWLWVQ